VSDRTLGPDDYRAAALPYGIDPVYMEAVAEVESAGSGFLADGRVKILFEGHVFWRRLQAYGIDPMQHVSGNGDVLYHLWTKRHYVGGAGEYDRLNRAARIHEVAAYDATSWGKFQILGEHAVRLGYGDSVRFAGQMALHEREHLDAFLRYCREYGLIDELRRQDTPAFARAYNGPRYTRNRYDEKIDRAYRKLKQANR